MRWFGKKQRRTKIFTVKDEKKKNSPETRVKERRKEVLNERTKLTGKKRRWKHY